MSIILAVRWARAHDQAAIEHAQALHKTSQALLVGLLDAENEVNTSLSQPEPGARLPYQALQDVCASLINQLMPLTLKRPDEKKLLPELSAATQDLLDAINHLQDVASTGASPGDSQEWLIQAQKAIANVRLNLAKLEEAEQNELARTLNQNRGIGWLPATLSILVPLMLFGGLAASVFCARTMFRGIAQSARPQSPPASLAPQRGPARAQALDKLSDLRTILDSSSAGIYVKDAGGRYLLTNDRFEALMQPRHPAIGRTDYDLFEKAVAGTLWADDVQTWQRGGPRQSEAPLPGGDPHKPFFLVKVPLYAGGKPYAICGAFIDLHDPAPGELNRLRDAHILGSVLNSMSDGVMILNCEGSCLFSNRSAEEMLGANLSGIRSPEWIKQFGLDGGNPGAFEELPLAQALHGTAVQNANIRLERPGYPDGLWLSVSASPLTNASGRVWGAVAILSDVTERQKTEQALNHAKEDAEHANQAKSEFLSRMSHELRTPLNAILGFAQLLDMARLPEQDKDSIQQILRAGRHLLGLINEVLDVARIESGRLTLSIEPVAAEEIVHETMSLIEPQAAQRNIQLYLETSPAWRSRVKADRQRLKQVLLNLMSNAVKYNQESGSVRISAEEQETYLRLNVADTGAGIAKDKFDLLFNPFERLGAEHTAVEGTGIGLALSKRLTEAMSGRIGMESEVGRGSTFWIELPLAGTDGDAGQRGSDLDMLSRNVGATRPPLVLCIEDNASNFRLIERTLGHRPEIKLMHGKLGASALSMAETHQPDLILLDMHLPDMGGDEVLGRLKSNSKTSEIPVVIVSADATPRQIEQTMQAARRTTSSNPWISLSCSKWWTRPCYR